MPPSSYHSWHALYDPFLTSGKAQSEVPWDNCLVTCIFLNPTNTKLFFLSFGSFVFFCKPLPVHCVPFNWNIFFTSSLCILVTDLLICHIFGKTQSFQQTVWIFKWDVKPSTRKHKTESCDMLLLKRGGAYNTHPKAKMPSSLPFYTLTVFVLMTPGLWEGVGWPLCARLCRGISPGDSHRSTLPKEDEWRAALDTAQWGLPCAPPPPHTTHFADPRPGIQASASGPSSVQVPTTLRAALGMQRSNAYTCWNSEPQTQWDSLWLKAVLMGKARVYGHTLPGSRCKQTKCERPFSRKLLKLGRAWVSSITCLW